MGLHCPVKALANWWRRVQTKGGTMAWNLEEVSGWNMGQLVYPNV